MVINTLFLFTLVGAQVLPHISGYDTSLPGDEDIQNVDTSDVEQTLMRLYLEEMMHDQDPNELGSTDNIRNHLASYANTRFSDVTSPKRLGMLLNGIKAELSRTPMRSNNDHKRFSEWLGGKKRFSEWLGGKKRFAEWLGGKKRFSEWLGGKKRFSEWLGGKKRAVTSTNQKKLSEILGGKSRYPQRGVRSVILPQDLVDKRNIEFLGGR